MLVFRLNNDYPLQVMLNKVERNARVLFVIFILLISSGGISLFLVVQEKWDELWLVFFLLIISVIVLLPLVLFLYYDYYRAKHSQYSLFQQPADSLTQYYRKIKSCRFSGSRVGISEQHIFALISSCYIPVGIPLSDIRAIYFLRYYTQQRCRCSNCFYVLTHVGILLKYRSVRRLFTRTVSSGCSGQVSR